MAVLCDLGIRVPDILGQEFELKYLFLQYIRFL